MTPSESIVSTANKTLVKTDSRGRAILIRQLTALDTLRLFKAAGPTLAQNEPWLAMASLAYAVSAIDGVPVPLPVNESQIETLIERLGEQGLEAVASAVDHSRPDDDMVSSVGNLLGTPS